MFFVCSILTSVFLPWFIFSWCRNQRAAQFQVYGKLKHGNIYACFGLFSSPTSLVFFKTLSFISLVIKIGYYENLPYHLQYEAGNYNLVVILKCGFSKCYCHIFQILSSKRGFLTTLKYKQHFKRFVNVKIFRETITSKKRQS